jgi:putative FmdB family regulatory protein
VSAWGAFLHRDRLGAAKLAPDMPTYDYKCERCGDFDALRSIAQRDQPADCPGCGHPAPRVLGGAPRLSALDAAARRGPTAQQRAAAEGTYQRMRCGAGCSCC